MIPESPPDLEFLGFKQLLDLAEASEKYVVYGARRICALHLRYAVLNPLSKLTPILDVFQQGFCLDKHRESVHVCSKA